MAAENGTQTKPEPRKVTVTLAEQQEAVVLHENTLNLVGKLFAAQDDIENESKFNRAFIHDAVVQGAKSACTRIIAQYEAAITKVTVLHPTMSREQAEKELLASKKMQALKNRVNIALSLKKEL